MIKYNPNENLSTNLNQYSTTANTSTTISISNKNYKGMRTSNPAQNKIKLPEIKQNQFK